MESHKQNCHRNQDLQQSFHILIFLLMHSVLGFSTVLRRKNIGRLQEAKCPTQGSSIVNNKLVDRF